MKISKILGYNTEAIKTKVVTATKLTLEKPIFSLAIEGPECLSLNELVF